MNRVLSWGMEPRQRDSFLAEGLADWDDMQHTEGTARVVLRALRGIPAGIWARLDEGDTTALPVSVAISLVGLAGTAAGLLERTDPMDMRRFVLLSAVGTFLLGALMMREPRRIVLRTYRLPGTLLAAGFLGMAANMPEPDQWPYETQVLETALIDLAMATGFAAVGIGFAAIVIASLIHEPRPLAFKGGVAVVVGTGIFGCAQIAWGIAAVTIDAAITVTSVGVGLAALSFIHVVPRLRKLQIVKQRELP